MIKFIFSSVVLQFLSNIYNSYNTQLSNKTILLLPKQLQVAPLCPFHCPNLHTTTQWLSLPDVNPSRLIQGSFTQHNTLCNLPKRMYSSTLDSFPLQSG